MCGKLFAIDPNDFIISRKRKKYKFAKFFNAANCFEFDEWVHRQVDYIEVGAGTGCFSLELARRHPDKVFMAIDVKADRLQKGAYAAIEQGVTNLYFVRARGDQIDELIEQESLEGVWVTFADPFPRRRSAGRRLSHPTYLRKYMHILRPSGHLYFKHDNPEFFQWTLEQLVAEKWRINELAFDLHVSELPDDYKVLTTYETRWLDEGRDTQFVRASKP
ncbi:MAG: tRNA (guanosine(46)-N7)-methyltransferase TrmB [Candidatus Saccharimonas sp.]